METKNLIILSSVFTASVAVFYCLFSSDILINISYNEAMRLTVSSIKDGMNSFLICFTLFFVAIALRNIFTGPAAKDVSNALMLFGCIVVINFYLTSSYINPEIRPLGTPWFYVMIAIITFATAYYISREYNQRMMPSIVKASAYFVLAFLIRFLLLAIAWEYIEYVAISAAVGLIFAGVATLLYPLTLSRNQTVKKTGEWFSQSDIDKFAIGFGIALYLSFLRPYLYGAYGDYALLAEWVCVALIAGGILFWLRSNLRTKMTDFLSLELYQVSNMPKRHKQKIDIKTTEEFLTVNEYIDEFVKEGAKADILLFIIKSSQEKGLTYDSIYDIVENLVNYQDIAPPRFAFLKETEFIQKENFERRRSVLTDTIQKLSKKYFQGK